MPAIQDEDSQIAQQKFYHSNVSDGRIEGLIQGDLQQILSLWMLADMTVSRIQKAVYKHT